MSDYHDQSVYENCASSLASAGDKYYLTHPKLFKYDQDLTNLRYAYVMIAYECKAIVDTKDGFTKHGWVIANNFTPNVPSHKPSGVEPGKYNFLDSACEHYSLRTPKGTYTFNGKLFTSGHNLAGCTLIFSSVPTHTLDGDMLPLWTSMDDPHVPCPQPSSNGSTVGSVVVYTSPVINIEAQLSRYPTIVSLHKRFSGDLADKKYLKAIHALANRFTFSLRKILYDILCPCHTCIESSDGIFIALNNCVPCVCRSTNIEECNEHNAFANDSGVALQPTVTKDCHKSTNDEVTWINDTCIECKPREIKDKYGNVISMFCPDGTICKTVEVETYTNPATCTHAGNLLPIHRPTCIKVGHVKKLVTDVNKLIEEANKYLKAYVSSLTVPVTKHISTVRYGKNKGKTKVVAEFTKTYTTTVVTSILTSIKSITVTCPPKTTTLETTTFSYLASLYPFRVKTTSATLTKWVFPEKCHDEDNDDLICLCPRPGECLDSHDLYAILLKISTKLQTITESSTVPFKITYFEDEEEEPDDDDAAKYYTWVKEKIFTGKKVHKSFSRTKFPICCECIQPPIPSSDGKHKEYPDTAVFKCEHTAQVLSADCGDQLIDASGCYLPVDLKYRTFTLPKDELEMWGADDKVTLIVDTLMPYKGWQMMGKISLSNFIEKYYGYSWNFIPGCCNGSDCLAQWHFELLWRVTQGLLYGNYSSFQGPVQQKAVIYCLNKCLQAQNPYQFITKTIKYKIDGDEQTCTYDLSNVSESETDPIVHIASVDTADTDMGLDGTMLINGIKYHINDKINKTYNRTYRNIDVPDNLGFVSASNVEGFPVMFGLNFKYTDVTIFHMHLIVACLLIRKNGFNNLDSIIEKLKRNSKDLPRYRVFPLLVSLVVDGLIEADSLLQLTELVFGSVPPRMYTLLLHTDKLILKAKEYNDKLVHNYITSNKIPETINRYYIETVNKGKSLLTPESLYEVREAFRKVLKDTPFNSICEEIDSDIESGCSGCRLSRLKRQLYREFCSILTEDILDDKQLLILLNTWCLVVPHLVFVRVVKGLEVIDYHRTQFIPVACKNARKIIIQGRIALGDMVALTKAVKYIKEYDSRYKIWLDVADDSVFKDNPLIERSELPDDGVRYVVGVPSGAPREDCSFIEEYTRALAHMLGLDRSKLSMDAVSPEIHNDCDKDYVYNKFGVKDYCVVICGYKGDHPLKHWGPLDSGSYYQKVIDSTKDKLRWVQLGMAKESNHHKHIKLDGVVDLVGHTDNNTNDFIALIKNAKLVLCPITGAVHIAAVFGVKCVFIAGAREPRHYFRQYLESNTHIMLDSLGKLKCASGPNGMCQHLGEAFANTCVNVADDSACMCMHMIKPDDVIKAINKLI